MRNKNPLFIEYYSHTQCDCYKIDLPWTRYAKDTLVLCAVEEGIEKANAIAEREIAKHLKDALGQPIKEQEQP